MKGKHCLLLLFILGALLACNDPKPVTDALHRAEALMNEHPDSNIPTQRGGALAQWRASP